MQNRQVSQLTLQSLIVERMIDQSNCLPKTDEIQLREFITLPHQNQQYKSINQKSFKVFLSNLLDKKPEDVNHILLMRLGGIFHLVTNSYERMEENELSTLYTLLSDHQRLPELSDQSDVIIKKYDPAFLEHSLEEKPDLMSASSLPYQPPTHDGSLPNGSTGGPEVSSHPASRNGSINFAPQEEEEIPAPSCCCFRLFKGKKKNAPLLLAEMTGSEDLDHPPGPTL